MKNLAITLLFVLLGVSAYCQETSSNEVLGNIIESTPEYPGGMKKFFSYILDNQDQDVDGKIFVSFFVEPTGKISEPTIVKGINPEVDSKVLELIKAMPDWKPAMYKGEAVRHKMVLPIDI